MLDFRIKTFLKVCECMNFTRAADELCITQPAVSQHIKYLENFYGSKLFEYEGKKIKLTYAGRLLYETSLTMQHDEKYLKDIIKQEKSGIEKIKFGATRTIGEFVLPEKLHNFHKKHKDMHIEVIVANTKTLLEKIDRGDIDFALIEGHFVKSEYDYLVYSNEEYICISGEEYVQEKSPCLLEDLSKETLIIREKGSGTRDILEKNLEDNNLSISDFKNVMEIGNISAIKYLVKNNDGLTFLYEAAVKNELKRGTLKKVNVSDLHSNHNFYFIWRKNSTFAERYKKIYSELK